MGKNPIKKGTSAHFSRSTLVRLGPILAILRASIWSSRVAEERPVSVMLVAAQESAKTQSVLFFQGTRTMAFISDLTSRGLLAYKNKIETKQIRHIVLLDLVRILSHGRGTSERTIQTLAGLCEEGEADTADGGGLQTWAGMPKIGLLTTVTPGFYNSRRGHWRQTGFLTRFLPVRFRYSNTAAEEIHHAIAKGHHFPHPQPERLPDGDVMVKIPVNHARTLETRAQEIGQQMKTYGFRYHRALRVLAKSHALSKHRGEVNSHDVAQVLLWSQFFTEKEQVL